MNLLGPLSRGYVSKPTATFPQYHPLGSHIWTQPCALPRASPLVTTLSHGLVFRLAQVAFIHLPTTGEVVQYMKKRW